MSNNVFKEMLFCVSGDSVFHPNYVSYDFIPPFDHICVRVRFVKKENKKKDRRNK